MIKASNEENWEPTNPCLTYQHNKENDQLCKYMVAMNYLSNATDEISDEVTAFNATELIS